MDNLKNPFSPGAGTPPPALLGREDLLDDFRVSLARTKECRPNQSIIPVGLRGVGKTVLLNKVMQIATEEFGVYASIFEVPEDADLRTIIIQEMRKILVKMDTFGTASDKVKKALRVLKSFSLSAPFGIELSIELEHGLGDSGNLTSDLIDLFTTAGEAAKDRGTAIVIALDEVQYLKEEYFAAIIAAIHRTTQLQLPIILVGTGLPQILSLAGSAKSYAERLFTFPRISPLSREESFLAIKIPITEAGANIEEGALEYIYSITQGYPYFLQEWGSVAWKMSQGDTITEEGVKSFTQSVLDKLDVNFFRVRYDRLTPTERKYLRAMAELGPGPHRSGDIARCYGAAVASVAPFRNNLIGKGMIYSPQYGDTGFTVPLFDEFMKRAMPTVSTHE